MKNLFSYILALQEEVPGLVITQQDFREHKTQDRESLIESKEWLVCFDNGVQLRKQVERDYDLLDDLSNSATNKSNRTVNSDMVCEECWISYQIVASPPDLHIHPQSKNFINECQEAFWLKMSKLRASL